MFIDENAPYGINLTKRFVSNGAEENLFKKYEIGESGKVELVDYMGGDGSVVRSATLGIGLNIFKENPGIDEFINYLVTNGIYYPFKSVIIKLNFQSPIEVGNEFIYNQNCSVNEYSLRYSTALESSFSFSIDCLINKYGEDKGKEAYELLKGIRKNNFQNYEKILTSDLAREIARSVLGSDQDSRYFWKIDLFSLSNFVKTQRKKSINSKRILDSYVDVVEDIASKTSPISWDALMNERKHSISLTMPLDSQIVNPDLSPSLWGIEKTKREIVCELEEKLFVIKNVLDHGQFQIIDYMGSDQSIAVAARTSYQKDTKSISDDKALVRSLTADRHTSPIEMPELSFEIKAPVFSDHRQLGRHRTLDFGGFMGYIPIGDQYYLPDDAEFKYQDRVNRQGRSREMDEIDKDYSKQILISTFNDTLNKAEKLRALGVSEEEIRRVKGVGFYTKTWRTGDAHNILSNMLRLRLEDAAQYEVRQYAQAISEAMEEFLPISFLANQEYVINSLSISSPRQKFISSILSNLASLFPGEIDFDDLNLYAGHGWIVNVDKNDPTKGKKLSREGLKAKENLKKLFGRD